MATMTRRTSLSDGALLVVGGGTAGIEAAFAGRGAGWQGSVTILEADGWLPYQRPPLSKERLRRASGSADEPLPLRGLPAFAKKQIELVQKAKVRGIDRTGQVVETEDGRQFAYDVLVLAPGGRARRLPLIEQLDVTPGNVHALRTMDDAVRLRAALGPGKSIVLIGAGYIGLEVASAAREHGASVTVLEGAPHVLARVTAPEVAGFYEDLHRARGVEIRTGVVVSSVELDESGARVVAVICADGERIPADEVLIGIGLEPDVELATAAGLEVGDGIRVDRDGRTSDDRIFAVGDCAESYNELYDRWVRIESVPNALEQARAVAFTLAGKSRRAPAVPWFWSKQYDCELKIVGLSQGYDDVVVQGSTEQATFSATYLRDGRTIAIDTVNDPHAFRAAKERVLHGAAL